MSLADRVVETLRQVLGETGFVPLHEPSFEGREHELVNDCLDTGWVSTAGKYVDEFERMLEAFTGAKRAVVTSCGTTALQVALQLAGARRGDEVLVPALTFVGTANSVAHLGATPHFVDSCESTLGVDPARLEAHLAQTVEMRDGQARNRRTGARVAALVPVHIFGHPADMDALLDLAARYRLAVVEDAAEALGSYQGERHAGTLAPMGILSFNGNKTITTGGGGAILFQDEQQGALAKHLTNTAKTPHKWEYFHDMTGYNFRLPNLNAALGCAQMELLPEFLGRKRRLAEAYAKAFARVPGLRFQTEPRGCTGNYWLNAILLDEPDPVLRDDVLEKTNAAGYMTRPAWTLLNRLPMYATCPSADLSGATNLAGRIVNIPSGPRIRVQS
ncbi:LegC family aminotransferase [Fundidesulfovibrio butyratiphilus]